MMKVSTLSSILMPAVLTWSSASGDKSEALTSNIRKCVNPDDFSSDFDFFPEKVVPKFSDHWSISYHKTYKVFTNTLSDVSYLLYQCGTEPPSDEDHHVVVPVPLPDGVAITSTTQIPYMELLGLRRQITAYIGDDSYVSSPCVKELLKDSVDKLSEFYNSTKNQTQVNNWIAENPGAVILAGPWDDNTLSKRVVISAAKEKTNKAVSEWLKVYGAFFNLEAMATETFEETADRYDCITSNSGVIVDDRLQGNQPKVLWAYYSTTCKGWDVAECPNYYCEFAKHCSAKLLDSNEGSIECYGAKYMTDEEFLAHGKSASYWLFPSFDWVTIYENKTALLDQFASVQNKKVFDYTKSSQNAWFEQRLAEYDVVLQDFCAVVGVSSPSQPLHRRRWFRNVFKEAPYTPGDLSECVIATVDEPLKTHSTECTRLFDTLDASPSVTLRASIGTILLVESLLFAFLV